MGKPTKEKRTVLVAVLKNRRDRDLVLREKWYRIPCTSAPKRTCRYLAFYQPALFGRAGKRIEYYARVKRIERRKRRVLLPRESAVPTANDDYFQIHLTRITKLPRPIKNTTPRRISFGFTTLARLKSARNILELYNVAPIEEIVGRALARAGIDAIPQYQVSRYRLDFAIIRHPVLCHSERSEESREVGISRSARDDVRVNIAIECDNKKAHSSKAQRARDRKKDAFLRRRGWRVIRLKEEAILLDIDSCIASVRRVLEES
jgi:hypothetical protein